MLGWGWSRFCRKHKLRPGEIIVLKLDAWGFKLKVFDRNDFTAIRYHWLTHI